MPTYTMERHDEGGEYFRAGAAEAELYANSGADGWREPEVLMSEAINSGTRGIETNVSRYRRVGYATGHLVLSKPHVVGPENYIG